MRTGAAEGDTDFADGILSGGLFVSQNDPTDNALAAIASILDEDRGAAPPPLPRETASPTADEKLVIDENPMAEEKPLAPEQTEADGYHRVGPGPIASLSVQMDGAACRGWRFLR